MSYCVLALVGDRGAGAHDIASMMRRGQRYWSGAESQWYAEPKRLASLGYLSARRLPGKTTNRTHYHLTSKGRRALQQWMAEPSNFPRIQNEAAVRLLGGDLIDDATIVGSLRGMRAELDAIDAEIDNSEAIALEIPERTKYLLLLHRYSRRLIAVHRDWIDEVERELSDSDRAEQPVKRGAEVRVRKRSR